MPAADFTTIAELRQSLIRKALRYAIFAADASAAAVSAPFDNDGVLQALPSGYVPVGYTTTDGVTFSGDLSTSDVESGQSASPTRSDVETDTQTAQWVPQETNAAAVALYENLPLAGAGSLPELGSATWTWSRPKTPPTRYRRLLFIAEDLNKETGQPLYIVRHFPSSLRTGREDEQWTRTAEISRGVTYQAYIDDVLGTDSVTWIDGPGWRDLAPLSDEVQQVAITGGPTGGTYTLSFNGQTTASIPYNASAATVQSALEALSNITDGDVVCSGGPHPGTPVVVTFGGQYRGEDVPQMTGSAASLTGGTSPAVNVTTTTPGGVA
ncbi:phage tail tube protein [Streptomyces sp. NPDC002611]